MFTKIARLSPLLLAFLTACSTPTVRQTAPSRSSVETGTSTLPDLPAKPNVVTVPIETGLETVPQRPMVPEQMKPSQDPDLNRPADATNSPYPSTGELPPAQGALPPLDPVMDPPLPAMDAQAFGDPGPVRTLAPRVGDKLFAQSAPPAVAALETDIEAQFRARRYGDAAAQIDRALRIQPKNAELWHVLAEIRLRQNQPGLAEDLAKKSNSLAKSNGDLVKSNWRIIADARRQQGDGAGAQDALEKAW